MKTYRLLTALLPGLGALALASCSDDVTAPGSDTPSAIRFAAQSPALSRAATTTETLDEFSVYAYTEGAPFMENVSVTKNASNAWEYSPAVYWPTTAVNFYAFSPSHWSDYEAGGAAAASADAPAFNPESPVDYYGEYGNTDLLYAVSMNQTQSGGPVVLNFRHALSQVIVDLRTDMAEQLDIKVSSVTVHGVKTSGAFTFPSATTAAGGTAKGSWDNESGSSAYIYYLAQTTDEAMTLTDAAQNTNVVSQGFLLPQTLGTATVEDSGATGDYIEVDCIIYGKASGKQVWPNSATPPAQSVSNAGYTSGRLYFPLLAPGVTEWQQGVKYIYTITINEPEGLEKIEFGSPTVDSYTNVTVEE